MHRDILHQVVAKRLILDAREEAKARFLAVHEDSHIGQIVVPPHNVPQDAVSLAANVVQLQRIIQPPTVGRLVVHRAHRVVWVAPVDVLSAAEHDKLDA